MLTFGSVCSGIEAASVAWHPLGWRASFLSEIETFPRSVLSHHYPKVPLHGDFTTIRAGEYESIDLLVGGTPCQSFSVAGLRGGLDDDRGNLALEYLRLADRLRPRWLVWENVPGVLSSNGGRDFGAILGGMVELGYGFAYRVLDAQFFGVAQRRRRVFVVGYAGDWRRAAAVLFERHSLQGHPAPRREAGKAAPTIPSRSTGGGGLGTDFDCDGGLIHAIQAGALRENPSSGPDGVGVQEGIAYTLEARAEVQAIASTGEVAHCLNAGGMGRQDYETETLIAFSAGADAVSDLSPTLRAGGHSKSHANAGVMPAVAFALRGRDGGAMPEVEGDGDRAGALRAASGGSSRDYVAFNITPSNSNKDYNARESDRAQALTAGGNRPSARGGDLIAASAVRRLTPRECERLQGFEDDYTLIPGWTKGAPKVDAEETARWILSGDAAWLYGTSEEKAAAWERGMTLARHPDGPRYKALGNSMAVPVMRWIGERIAAVEAIENIDKRQAA